VSTRLRRCSCQAGGPPASAHRGTCCDGRASRVFVQVNQTRTPALRWAGGAGSGSQPQRPTHVPCRVRGAPRLGSHRGFLPRSRAGLDPSAACRRCPDAGMDVHRNTRTVRCRGIVPTVGRGSPRCRGERLLRHRWALFRRRCGSTRRLPLPRVCEPTGMKRAMCAFATHGADDDVHPTSARRSGRNGKGRA
jgi:hypothetical protein